MKRIEKFYATAIDAWDLLLLGTAILFMGTGAAAESAACEPHDGVEFICGLQNPEDLIWVPGSEWLIASGLAEGDTPGQLYLINPADRSFETLYAGAESQARHDTEMFGDCPGLPDPARLSMHGLSIRAHTKTMQHLYVTGHGAREAIEVFEIDSSGKKPKATWIGCVEIRDDASINSVAILNDGGFVTTRMVTRDNPDSLQDLLAGKNTGHVYEWHPGSDVMALPGTELAGPNGILVSPDGKWMFVAAWGTMEVVRFARGKQLVKDEIVKLDMRVDNIRWTADGGILATGHRLAQNQSCGLPMCVESWGVAKIDPKTMTARSLFSKGGSLGFTVATVAVQGHGGLWLGTFLGDRIAFLPTP